MPGVYVDSLQFFVTKLFLCGGSKTLHHTVVPIVILLTSDISILQFPTVMQHSAVWLNISVHDFLSLSVRTH